jgi:hypothetical protein
MRFKFDGEFPPVVRGHQRGQRSGRFVVPWQRTTQTLRLDDRGERKVSRHFAPQLSISAQPDTTGRAQLGQIGGGQLLYTSKVRLGIAGMGHWRELLHFVCVLTILILRICDGNRCSSSVSRVLKDRPFSYLPPIISCYILIRLNLQRLSDTGSFVRNNLNSWCSGDTEGRSCRERNAKGR